MDCRGNSESNLQLSRYYYGRHNLRRVQTANFIFILDTGTGEFQGPLQPFQQIYYTLFFQECKRDNLISLGCGGGPPLVASPIKG